MACPDETITFTCTLALPGSIIRWDITPPQGAQFSISLSASNTEGTLGSPAFRGVITDSNGPLTATLTSLSEASIVEGITVECLGESSREGPLTITLAGEWLIDCIRSYLINTLTDPPTPPLNPRVSSAQNQPNFSNITLEWDSPSSTGGVSVSYVLTMSPTPLSGSPVTVETTSAQITVSYNIPYNVTIRADNCAGMSQESSDISIILSDFLVVQYSSLMQLYAPHRLLLLV